MADTLKFIIYSRKVFRVADKQIPVIIEIVIHPVEQCMLGGLVKIYYNIAAENYLEFFLHWIFFKEKIEPAEIDHLFDLIFNVIMVVPQIEIFSPEGLIKNIKEVFPVLAADAD